MNVSKVILLSATMLATGAGTALAQDDDGSSEIIVTATKRAQSLQSVPASIAAVQPDQLAVAGVSNAEDLANVTSGVAVDTNAHFASPYIRGIGTQYANPGLEPSVAIYIDDVYVSRASAGLLTFSDIERIEVLKGPQGTLYGMSNTGGAIRIITRKPSEELTFGGSVAFGNYGQEIADMYLSGPILGGLRGRISGQVDKNDGWLDPVGGVGPTAENRDLKSIRGQLAWDVTNRLLVSFMADYSDKDGHEGQGFINIYTDPAAQIGILAGGQGSTDLDHYAGNLTDALTEHVKAAGAELRIDYDLDGVTLSSITGFRHTDFEGNADLDNTTAAILRGQVSVELTDTIRQEFQAVSDGQGWFNYTLGLHYYHEDGKNGFSYGSTATGGALGLGSVNYDSLAPYANLEFTITPELELVVGGRYTWTDKKLNYNNIFGGPFLADGFTLDQANAILLASEGSKKFESEKLSPKIGLNWTPTSDLLFYISYNKRYKAGGFNLPQPGGLVDQVDNEQLDAYEIGWKHVSTR